MVVVQPIPFGRAELKQHADDYLGSRDVEPIAQQFHDIDGDGFEDYFTIVAKAEFNPGEFAEETQNYGEYKNTGGFMIKHYFFVAVTQPFQGFGRKTAMTLRDGKITTASDHTIRRASKVKHPRAYIEADGAGYIDTRQVLDPAQAGLEFMMNALRLNEGFTIELYRAHTGLPLTVVERPLARAGELGLIERDAVAIRPSERGRRYLNELLTLFVPEE